jgi:hypothetical protein
VTEAYLQAAVIDLCRHIGVVWYHAYSSRRSVPGWPDLALCGSRGFMLRELKAANGRLKVEQQHWGLILRAAGQNWDVWRPVDLQSGRIQSELLAIK